MNLSIFVERLKEYKEDENLTATALANIVDFSRVTLTNVLNGVHAPSTKLFLALITHFNCSADYILGLTDFPKSNEFAPFQPISNRLRECLKSAGRTQSDLQTDLNLSSSLTYRWLYKGCLPTIDSFLKLSAYFECSVDYLLSRER